jgi:hypothetical protein
MAEDLPHDVAPLVTSRAIEAAANAFVVDLERARWPQPHRPPIRGHVRG